MANRRPVTRVYCNATQTMKSLHLKSKELRIASSVEINKETRYARDYTDYLHYNADYSSRMEEYDPVKEEVFNYTGQMIRILEAPPTKGTNPIPSEILPRIFLGSVSHAENIELLKRMGIKYILNCAGIAAIRVQREARYAIHKDAGILGYEELPAEDSTTYDITHHFLKAFRFIDSSRTHGRVLVYCPDVNRSGAIAIGYLLSKGHPILEAAKIVKDKRKGALFNRGFMQQLVKYARDHHQLTLKNPYLGMHQRPNVKDRDKKAHLLTFF